MSKLLVFFLVAAAAFAADDPWAKVRDLKSGTELRIYKKGAAQPVLAKSADVTDDNLVVLVKNEQIAIAKDLIDRIDYRPQGGRATTETKTKTTDPDYTPGPMNRGAAVPGTSSSTSVGIGSKPDFEVLYRRPPATPKK
ncbi:MAG TPA: hypothetical protein VKU19_41040 [Bryobacteraceae bacterium]|nr:hypothetical protein [Bryobacteraceae bacterium]